MNFKLEDYPKDDCMRIARFLVVDIFQYKLMKLLIGFLLIFNVVLVVIQTYLFLRTFQSSYFIVNAPVYFVTLFLISACLSNLIAPNLIKEALIESELRKIENAHGKILRRMKIESKFFNIFCIINTILLLICGFQHLFLTEDEKLVFFPFKIFETFFPNWEHLLSCLYRATFLLGIFLMPAGCLQMVYCTTHMRFQIYIILDYLVRVDESFNTMDDLMLPYDDDCQKFIKETIVAVAIRYCKLRRLSTDILKKIQIFIVLYSLSGTALGMSLLMSYLTLSGHYQLRYSRLALVSFLCAINGAIVLIAGQESENLNEEGTKKYNSLKWYRWNKENRQNYITHILSMSVPFRIQFSQGISLNFDLGLRIGRALYSMISVLIQLK